MKKLIDMLEKNHYLDLKQWLLLIENRNEIYDYACERACAVRDRIYGNDIFVRGLIEISNICKNDCFYCGIRKSNKKAQRYRLTESQILDCCEKGYKLGFRTFVLQGGEDGFYTDDTLVNIISTIHSHYPDCAITLSLGEKSRESYQKYFDAGADRYLLRHETANSNHYAMLHPDEMSFENRMRCLENLKSIGYQTGCGFMVGSPEQTSLNIAEDMMFISQFKPQMVGIGPFISHCDTPFCNKENGSVELTVFMLALLRLCLPRVLLPATTALGTLDSKGREKAVLAGANVIMPNLSPDEVKPKYLLYDNKIATGEEAAQSVAALKARMAAIGYTVVTDRGDYKAE